MAYTKQQRKEFANKMRVKELRDSENNYIDTLHSIRQAETQAELQLMHSYREYDKNQLKYNKTPIKFEHRWWWTVYDSAQDADNSKFQEYRNNYFDKQMTVEEKQLSNQILSLFSLSKTTE